MCEIPKEAEIWHRIKYLNPTKAPGPDGMTGLFSHNYWHIVKENVVLFIQIFFMRGRMLREINHTNIALIPKIPKKCRNIHDNSILAHENFHTMKIEKGKWRIDDW